MSPTDSYLFKLKKRVEKLTNRLLPYVDVLRGWPEVPSSQTFVC